MTQPEEKEAIRTTIVGGRPPGCGKDVGDVPRGIELLVKKAAVDAEFRALLLVKRGDAADEIDLTLTAGEKLMLQATPSGQLEAIIANTSVAPRHRRALMGKAAAVMLVALSASLTGCKHEGPNPNLSEGIRPDPPEPNAPAQVEPDEGASPDRSLLVSMGSRPESPRDKPQPQSY